LAIWKNFFYLVLSIVIYLIDVSMEGVFKTCLGELSQEGDRNEDMLLAGEASKVTQ